MSEDIEHYPDRIARLLGDRTILLTGSTGFVGKILIEKLLRCFDVKRIYVLMREKWGADVNERAEALFKKELFNMVRECKGENHIADTCVIIPYDLARPDLGLSEEHRQTLISEVEVVFHSAAEVRSHDSLKKVILTNVRAVKCMLDLSKEMQQLQIFVHVSTIFCHPDQKVVREVAYPPATDPQELIKVVESMSDEEVEKRKHKILGNIHNSYTFTKNLGEALCVEQFDSMPIIVIRPSIGWFDSLNGPMGLLVASGKGIMRGMYANPEAICDMVPVDVLINAIVCCMWGRLMNRKDRQFFNICSSPEYTTTFQDLVNVGLGTTRRLPFNNTVWLPSVTLHRSKVMHRITLVFFNYLPALIVDGILICLRYKPVLWRIEQKLIRGLLTLEYFANKDWNFKNDETIKDREYLNPKERKLYKLDGGGLNYDEYHLSCTHAARLYIFKEPDDTIPAAKRHLKIMICADYITKYLFRFLVLYLLYKYMFIPTFGKIF